MKKILLIAFAIISSFQLHAQSHYWVMLTDKAGTTFDPYSYFDQKAIERYRLNNADLYDITNYPLNDSYVQQIDAVVTDLQSGTEIFGQSRWFNAVAVTATPDQVARIKQLPFVREVVMLEANMQLAESGERKAESNYVAADLQSGTDSALNAHLHAQLQRMGGKYFRAKGINGKGIRIAIFDGGFPQVNTHAAFKHVRDEHRIIKTWNFPNKKEDVYGWNSHGLMTFGCIAGREGDVDLGMATGAEYLLARTEIEAEPFKEEVWWQMAVEWADKNGAQIISSSLGYGKDRYYTKDMNGQSYVAKAGNMAARKGMLVCNSAGNEGDDNKWRTIITPSDADSVLCVGGLDPSLTDYQRTSFSSFGPSADGRQKPNVTAFAWARSANTGKSNEEYHVVPGTSFSCPLVAGFAACALQAKPGLTAMQLFHEIEKSADLYPYCDYSYGYGVPQADYFTGDRKPAKPTFKFVQTDSSLTIVPLKDYKKCRIFIKNSNSSGEIINYQKIELKDFTTDKSLILDGGNIITAQMDGYVAEYTVKNSTNAFLTTYCYPAVDFDQTDETHFSYSLDEGGAIKESYYQLGIALNTSGDELSTRIWSPAKRIGIRQVKHLSKAYALGFALEYGHTSFRFDKTVANRLDTLMAMDDDLRWLDNGIVKHKVNLGELGIELFQRIRLRPCGVFHNGWHWDLGVYGNWAFNVYKLKGEHNGDVASTRKQTLRNLNVLADYRWNYGITTRLTRDWIGLYARYRLNGIGKDVAADKVMMPRLEVGINLSIGALR